MSKAEYKHLGDYIREVNVRGDRGQSLDILLCHMFDEGTKLGTIAVELGRSEVAIKRRLRRLGKI